MAEPNQLGDKAYIRKQMMIKRNSLTPEQRELWSEAACANAEKLLESRNADAFMVYAAFRSELDLSRLIEWGWRTGRDVLAPRCLAADRSMTLHYLRSWDDLMPGAYGIMEPNPDKTPKLDDYAPSVIFVPGIAFNKDGGRLGYGGGYYDRFAEAYQGKNGKAANTLWIGMSFEDQITAEIPLERHDLKMNGLITERGIYLL